MDPFPELNLNHLKTITKRWVDDKPEVLFPSIRLYRVSFINNSDVLLPTRFAVVFEFPDYRYVEDPLPPGLPYVLEDGDDVRRMKIRLPNRRGGDTIKRFVETHTCYRRCPNLWPSKIFTNYRDFDLVYSPSFKWEPAANSFHSYSEKPETSHVQRWIFLSRCKEDSLPGYVLKNEISIVLYPADEQSSSDKKNKNRLSHLEQQLDNLLKKICPELEKFYTALVDEIDLGDYGAMESINEIEAPELHKIATDYFDRAENEYKVLKKSLVQKESLYTFSGQRRRLLIRNFLQEYLKDHPAMNNKKIQTSKEALHNRYNKINGLT